MSHPFIDLQSFIPALSPGFASPRHLAPLTSAIERAADGEEIKASFSTPPRHWKTDTLLFGIAWTLARRPDTPIALATYGQRLSERKSRRARQFTERAGVALAPDSKARSHWSTAAEGGVFATSVEGPITGEGFQLIVLDDLVKGRAEAESSAIRQKTRDWLVSDVLTRLEPGGSIIATGTRWHTDDAISVLIGLGFTHTNLPAIDDEGRALLPERFPIERLLARREELGGERGYEWLGLYQGVPPSRGTAVFGDVVFFDELWPERERHRVQIRIGVDFAYSTKTSADFSVAVTLARLENVFYVLDVQRVREEPREFCQRVQGIITRYPTARVVAYVASTELGGIEFLRNAGIPIEGRVARADKFSRAIGVSAAWNSGRVRLPRSAPWLDQFVRELVSFTGVRDRFDDQVDALAAAFDGLFVSTRTTRGVVVETHTWDSMPLGFEHGFHGRVSTGGEDPGEWGGGFYSPSLGGKQQVQDWLASMPGVKKAAP